MRAKNEELIAPEKTIKIVKLKRYCLNVHDLLNTTTATWTKALDATQKATFYAFPAACSALFKQA